ncbi:hypothetical protein ACF0H5_007003 [Mactra antiquata]
MFWYIVLICTILLVLVYISMKLSPRRAQLKNKHVIVTGGSSGIGKAIAILAAERGANVTIFARNKLRLEEAKTEIKQKLQTGCKVQCISVDLSSNYEDVKKAVSEAEDKLGPVFMVVNSAGTSVSRSFQDLQADDFKKMMEANYYSAVFTTKAAVDSMVQQQQGRLIFLSSQAGQIGLFGFSAYSGSKFALRGMAEALQMEMTPHNIRVTVAFPPDTDTPGFQHELIGKPKETQLISETAGLLKPQDVAMAIIDDSLKGEFISYQGMDGWLLAHVTAGMSPATSLPRVIQQFFLMGLFRVIGLFYLASFDSIVLKCKKEKDSEKVKAS